MEDPRIHVSRLARNAILFVVRMAKRHTLTIVIVNVADVRIHAEYSTVLLAPDAQLLSSLLTTVPSIEASADQVSPSFSNSFLSFDALKKKLVSIREFTKAARREFHGNFYHT